MFSAGIDAGMHAIKVVILRDGELCFYFIVPGGKEATASVAERGLFQTVEKAGISLSEIKYIVATGTGKAYVTPAHEIAAEFLCLAKGINQILPSTRTVLDIGAQKSLAVRCCQGRPISIADNDKCAAGTGAFLDMVAKILDIGIESIGELSQRSTEHVEVLSTCAVFAESEIISLIHMGKKPQDILKGVLRGLAFRVYSLLLKINFEKDLALVGGVARNSGVVWAIEEQVGYKTLIPKNPEIVGALGAALIAEEKGRIAT